MSIDELSGDALDEELARHFNVATEEVTVGNTRFVLKKPENSDHLISEADYVVDERLPYWAELWPSSRILAATLLEERGAGRTLLELGCGLGLATTAAMQAGFDVTATDYYVDAIHTTRANAWRNLGREPITRHVDWRHWPEQFGPFDVVVAADVLYEQEYAVLVAQTIAKAMAPNGEALIADPGRIALPLFLERVAAEGLRIVETKKVPWDANGRHQEIQVFRIVRDQTDVAAAPIPAARPVAHDQRKL